MTFSTEILLVPGAQMGAGLRLQPRGTAGPVAMEMPPKIVTEAEKTPRPPAGEQGGEEAGLSGGCKAPWVRKMWNKTERAVNNVVITNPTSSLCGISCS